MFYQELKISKHLEAYIKSLVLKETLESISLERRRAIEDGMDEQKFLKSSVYGFYELGYNAQVDVQI